LIDRKTIDGRWNLCKLHEENNGRCTFADPADYMACGLPRCDLERSGYVELKLAEELLFGAEFSDASDAVENLQLQTLPIKISLESNQMSFHFAQIFSEGRIRSDVQRHGVASKIAWGRNAGRVDAMLGNQYFDSLKVGCGKA
jgi:hypothetical protein